MADAPRDRELVVKEALASICSGVPRVGLREAARRLLAEAAGTT